MSRVVENHKIKGTFLNENDGHWFYIFAYRSSKRLVDKRTLGECNFDELYKSANSTT